MLGEDHRLAVSGRGFSKGEEIVLTIREGPFLNEVVRADESGRFSTSIQMSDDLPYGPFTIEAAREGKAGPPPFAAFAKAYGDDELLEREMRQKSGAEEKGGARTRAEGRRRASAVGDVPNRLGFGGRTVEVVGQLGHCPEEAGYPQYET